MKKLIALAMAVVMIFSFVSCLKIKSKKLDSVEKRIGLDMVKIPERDIQMLRTEVTQEFYEKIMGNNPSSNKSNQYPVESVSWFDAVELCNKLSQMNKLKPAYIVMDNKDVTWDQKADGYRLPTEAEWEFCSKGGKDFKYSGSDDIEEVAWYNKNSNGSIHPVAEKKANDYGLYDMSGNVFEWCWDSAFGDGNSSCDKGGSYKNKEDTCSITAEDYSGRNSKYKNLGIRLVRGKISDIDRKSGEEKLAFKIKKEKELVMKNMIMIPDQNYSILRTEVTQELYQRVMGINPSENKGANNPVENIIYYDSIVFCNRLSERTGLTPVYTQKNGVYEMNPDADGFRLPTWDEFRYCFKGGQNFEYSGSDNLNEVAWHAGNSFGESHPVGKKKANGYGLYDMSGNVSEWFWGPNPSNGWTYGGSFDDGGPYCDFPTVENIDPWDESNYIPDPDDPDDHYYEKPKHKSSKIGFRIVCNAE